MNALIKLKNFFVYNTKVQNVIFFSLVIVLAFAYCIRDGLLDVDLWDRLIMGAHVIKKGLPLYYDIISYTPTHTWYDHEWLSSALLYLTATKTGFLGLSILKTLLTSLTIILAVLVVAQGEKTINFKYKFGYTFLLMALFFHIAFFSRLRCQNFTFVFYPILFLILERIRYNYNSKAIWFIPPLMLLWLNIHGGSMYGVGIIILYAIGEFLNKKPSKKFFLILIPTLLVYLINPWGIDFIKFLIDAIYVDRQWIGEWKTPFSMEGGVITIYLINLSIVAFTYIYSNIRRKFFLEKTTYALDWTKLLIMCATLILALRYIKYNSLFFMTSFMLMYSDFRLLADDIVRVFKRIFKRTIPLERLWGLIVILFCISTFQNYSIKTNVYNQSLSEFAVLPAQFLKYNNIKGKVFAPYYLGGFLAYKLYPDIKIYMDGRQEQVYSYDIFKKQMEFLFYLKEDAIKVLDEYPPDIIVIENYWQGLYALAQRSHYWQKVYEDGTYYIFLAPHMQKRFYYMPKGAPDFTQEKFFDTKIEF